MNRLVKTVSILLIFVWGNILHAQTSSTELVAGSDTLSFEEMDISRVLTTTYALEAGGERAFNTYLSPLVQTGWNIGLAGTWERSMGSSTTWHQQIDVRARLGIMTNPAGNAYMDDVQATLSWSALRSFPLTHDFTLSVGAGALLEGGILYVPRNSNNPVAARAYLGGTFEGRAAYSFRFKSKRLKVLESVSLPTIGIFFSPHYGQSYYEIYLGDTSGLARCAWWGNRFALNNHLALEIPFGTTSLRLGYRFEVTNSIASDINSRITVHSFTLGITTDWIRPRLKTTSI